MTVEVDKGSGVVVLEAGQQTDLFVTKGSAVAVLEAGQQTDLFVTKGSVIVVLTPNPVPRIISNQPPPVGATE